MEFLAEFTEGRSRDRARQIIKGKRTKRQRPSSPFSMSTSTTSGNSDCFVDSFTADQSSVTTSSKEDEDMANCLIMLAQSFSPVKEVKSDYQIREKTESMLSSRRFTEMNGDIVGGGGGGGGRACLYVYECKACNRTFPSFQALGGHRASHKKPKLSVEEKKSSSVNYNYNYTSPPLTEYLEEDHDRDNVIVEDEENKASTETILNNNVQKSPSAPSGFVQTGIISINHNTKSKVHECSICGSEFLSGQALGGHMRKHRPIPPPSVNRTVISTNTDVNHKSTDQIIEKSPSSMLSLDLNFPPPETVADHQSMFQFTANSSQNRIYNSAPAFVDCHY